MDVTGAFGSIPQVDKSDSKFAEAGNDAEKLRLDFLKLLTAQLEYQDPLEPLENTEFTSQMAQFSSLSEQQRSNKILEDLLSVQGVNQLNNAVSYIGKSVVTAGNRTMVENGKTSVRFNLAENAAAAIHLYDGSGRLVKSTEAQTFQSGEQSVEILDPALADGLYTFSVVIPGEDGAEKAVTTLEKGVVTGVVNGKEGVTLEMNGRQVELTEVRRVEQVSSS